MPETKWGKYSLISIFHNFDQSTANVNNKIAKLNVSQKGPIFVLIYFNLTSVQARDKDNSFILKAELRS